MNGKREVGLMFHHRLDILLRHLCSSGDLADNLLVIIGKAQLF